MAIALDGRSLTLESAMEVAEGGAKVSIRPESLKRMARFRSVLEEQLSKGQGVYGVGTGIGSLAGREVSLDEVESMQVNLIRSHSAGVGEPMPLDVVRAAMLIRINSLVNGNSASRPVVAEKLAELLNKGVVPYVPRYGSLGASGDLVPAAHIALTLIGEGKAYWKGRLMNSADALSASATNPIVLQAKEGLSLINGTCFTAALGAMAVHRGKLILAAGNSTAAFAADVLGSCSQAFDERLSSLKKSHGQRAVASQLRRHLKGSRRIRSDALPQDPYSIRCAPQVHGSVAEALDFAEGIAVGEMNSVSDNPVLFEDGSVLHGGNFHAQPVAMVLDLLAIAASYIGVLSLARINLLLSRSPKERKFMAHRPGLESGLMILEYTATALNADNSMRIHPQSSYPANVSEGIEDHASHGVNAGIKAGEVIANVSRILAIELICTSNFLGEKMDGLSPHSRRTCAEVRATSPLLDGDRSLSGEMDGLAGLIMAGKLP
jgi:histidine ammonia-lyase